MQSFDFTMLLPLRTSSPHTQRAYYRWVDRYLVDVAGYAPTQGEARLDRMRKLPIALLNRHLTPRKLKNWLNHLVEEGQGRQALDQARAAIVTLTDIMAQGDYLADKTARAVQSVSVPPIQKKAVPERLLSSDEVRRIMAAARNMATSDNQRLRNDVVATMLCTMALRREELATAVWGDLGVRDGTVALNITETDYVDMPRPVLLIVDRWRKAIQAPPRDSALVRRIWKGGRIADEGLSSDGIWLIVRNAAREADLGHVTPEDLRRSAVANMYRNGMPIEEISRLLRHRSLLITERFLAKLGIKTGSKRDQNSPNGS